MQEKDRRKSIRIQAYHLVKYSKAGQGQTSPMLATISDIGSGGICLRTEEDLPASTLLKLQINFPGLTQPVCALAKVVWTKPIGKTMRYEVGLEFVEIDETARKLIDEHAQFIKEHAEKKKGLFSFLFKKGGG